MKKIVAGFGMAALALAAVPAEAEEIQPLGQKLGECMVLKTTGADRLVVARWLLGVLASAPQAADVTVLQPGKKEAGDRDMAALFTRLLVKDCAAESKALFATGAGSSAGFRIGGEALGRVAMEELLGNPASQQALSGYTKFLKPEDFKGVAAPAK